MRPDDFDQPVTKKVINLPRPRTFTSSEVVIEYLAERIMADKRGYQKIADACGVSISTIHNIASRKTKWPRPHTFFAVLAHYNIKLTLR